MIYEGLTLSRVGLTKLATSAHLTILQLEFMPLSLTRNDALTSENVLFPPQLASIYISIKGTDRVTRSAGPANCTEAYVCGPGIPVVSGFHSPKLTRKGGQGATLADYRKHGFGTLPLPYLSGAFVSQLSYPKMEIITAPTVQGCLED